MIHRMSQNEMRVFTPYPEYAGCDGWAIGGDWAFLQLYVEHRPLGFSPWRRRLAISGRVFQLGFTWVLTWRDAE